MRGLIAVFLLFALSASAADVILTWNPMPAGQSWTQVRIYERTGTAGAYTYARKAEVTGDKTTATISDVVPGVHTYVARSYVTGGWESVDSVPASTPDVPIAPSLTVTVTIAAAQPNNRGTPVLAAEVRD
jgi:hypothetical protein